MESIWNDFAKLVGRVLAERWMRRQGISTDGKHDGVGKKRRAPTEACGLTQHTKPARRTSLR